MQSVFEDMQFPVYRKYKNNKRFYKVMSPTEFEEIQLVGTKTIVTRHTATILPERQFVYDLCFDGNVAETITEEEYTTKL